MISDLTDSDLLARINCRSSAMRSYERADGPAWYEERRQREACLAELSALTAEWRRRHREAA